MKELRVTGITEKVNSIVEDENYILIENFVKQGLWNIVMTKGGYSKPRVASKDLINGLEQLFDFKTWSTTFLCLQSMQLTQVQVEGIRWSIDLIIASLWLH